jgi:hypothetical protein
MLPCWLPDLILLSDFNGDWNRYFEAIYEQFRIDFVAQHFLFRGKRVSLKCMPRTEGKEATFWHFISEGCREEDRLPDMRRCERIGWPRAIMDNCDDDCLQIWNEEVNGEQRVHIWCESAEYLTVVADRNGYVLPWTAYPISRPHQKAKIIKRWRKHTNN